MWHSDAVSAEDNRAVPPAAVNTSLNHSDRTCDSRVRHTPAIPATLRKPAHHLTLNACYIDNYVSFLENPTQVATTTRGSSRFTDSLRCTSVSC